MRDGCVVVVEEVLVGWVVLVVGEVLEDGGGLDVVGVLDGVGALDVVGEIDPVGEPDGVLAPTPEVPAVREVAVCVGLVDVGEGVVDPDRGVDVVELADAGADDGGVAVVGTDWDALVVGVDPTSRPLRTFWARPPVITTPTTRAPVITRAATTMIGTPSRRSRLPMSVAVARARASFLAMTAASTSLWTRPVRSGLDGVRSVFIVFVWCAGGPELSHVVRVRTN